MIPVGIRKYSFQSAQDRVLTLLKKTKGNPLSVEEISYVLNLSEDTVRHVIHSIQKTTDLCQTKDKFYFSENQTGWWLVAFGLMVACALTVCEVIKNYHY